MIIPQEPAVPTVHILINPDSKVHGDNMGPIWGRQDPGGPHVGPMNFAIWEHMLSFIQTQAYDLLNRITWACCDNKLSKMLPIKRVHLEVQYYWYVKMQYER